MCIWDYKRIKKVWKYKWYEEVTTNNNTIGEVDDLDFLDSI